MLNNLNQYLITRYPTIWNTKLVPATIFLVFFNFFRDYIVAFFSGEQTGASLFGLLSFVASVLLTVAWFKLFNKQKALNSLYPISSFQLFGEYLSIALILALIWSSIRLFISLPFIFTVSIICLFTYISLYIFIARYVESRKQMILGFIFAIVTSIFGSLFFLGSYDAFCYTIIIVAILYIIFNISVYKTQNHLISIVSFIITLLPTITFLATLKAYFKFGVNNINQISKIPSDLKYTPYIFLGVFLLFGLGLSFFIRYYKSLAKE